MTSIEWFIEHLLGNGLLRLTKEDHNLYSELRDKAKEMHNTELESLYTEEDIKKAFEAGHTLGVYLADYKHDEMYQKFIQSLKKNKKISHENNY